MTIHPTIAPRPGVLDIAPYVPGASEASTTGQVFKLSSNENPYGPSPAAKEAASKVAENMHLYPDSGHGALREAIAEIHGVASESIVCGAGSDELIALLCKAYAGPGDEVLHSQHGFLMYAISAKAAGATPVAVAERNLTTDIDAMIAALTERTRLVFVADPNNPTGSMVGTEELERLADALPPRALLAVDAAYAEFVTGCDGEYDGGARLVANRDNTVMLRTFSKIHGLSALRLGWCCAPSHVVEVLNRVRGPFNVNAVALAAGVAAVRDRKWVAQCAAENTKWRDWTSAELTRLNIPIVPSSGNFLLVEIGERAGACVDFLAERGVLVRKMNAYGLPQHLRVSIGTEDGCRAFIAGIRDWLA